MPKIQLTREKNYLGMIRKFKVYLNGKQIGTVPNGGTSEFEVPEGNHQLYCKQDFLNVAIPFDFNISNDEIKTFTTRYEKTKMSMFLLIFGSMSSILFSRWFTDKFKLEEYFYSLIYLSLFGILLFSLRAMKAFQIKIIEK
jgi:hypothetical protein